MVECINGCGGMAPTHYEGVEIDVCGTCSGVWLDFGELTEIVEIRDASWSASVIEKTLASLGGKGVPAEERERELTCRVCSLVLPASNYQTNSGVIVNACPDGHGVWLDSGELEKLQIYMERWQDIAARDSGQYQNLLRQIEADYAEKEKQSLREGPAYFDFINIFINRLINLME